MDALGALQSGGYGQDVLSWQAVAAAKAECARLQQQSVLHNGQYATCGDGFLALRLMLLAACCGVAVAAMVAVARGRRLSQAAARDAALQEKCKGLQSFAFHSTCQLVERTQALKAASEQRDIAVRELSAARTLLEQLQQQQQQPAHAQQQQAVDGASTDSECRPEDCAVTVGSQLLEGECSAPDLGQLVAEAPNRDAGATPFESDQQACQRPPAPASKAPAFEPEADVPLQQLAAQRNAQQVVDYLNAKWAEAGLGCRFQLQDAAAASISSSPAACAAAASSPASQHKMPQSQQSPQQSPQQMQQLDSDCTPEADRQPAERGGSGGQFATLDQLTALKAHVDVKLVQKELQQLEQKRDEVASELSLFTAQKQAAQKQAAAALLFNSPASAFINTSRGSSTPLNLFPRTSGGGASVGKFGNGSSGGGVSPFGMYSAPRSAGGAASTGNSDSGSCYAARNPVPSSSAPGSSSSARQSFTPASIRSGGSGRGSDVGPVPMQSLDEEDSVQGGTPSHGGRRQSQVHKPIDALWGQLTELERRTEERRAAAGRRVGAAAASTGGAPACSADKQ